MARNTTPKLEHIYPHGSNGYGGAYRLGKYEIWRVPETWKRIWRVWEGETAIDGFPTLHEAVQAIRDWEEIEKGDPGRD